MAAVPKLSPDIPRALDRVIHDARRGLVHDLIGDEDLIAHLKEDPGRLKALMADSYKPKRPMHVAVPKTSLTVRPTLRVDLAERALVQVLVETFAVATLGDLPDWVCGWRFTQSPQSPDDLADNNDEWKRYNTLLQTYEENGPRFVLKTDIANFFHHVPLSTLRDSLQIPSPVVKKTLLKFLETWSPAGVGLPQPMLASALLANAYLRPLDAVLSSHEAVRWMDDVTVFCLSRSEAVGALVRIQDVLRRLNLGINRAKTSLTPPHRIDFSPPGFRLTASAWDAVEDPTELSAYPPIPPWDEVIRSDEVDRRVFGVYTRRLPHDPPDPFADQIVSSLDRLPHVADHASRYLRDAPNQGRILRGVQDFLAGPDNQFVWQEYRLATLFWHAPSLPARSLSFALKRAMDGNVFVPTRGVYLRALAKHGTADHVATIEEMAAHEDHPAMLRCLMIAAAESGRVPWRRVKNIAGPEPRFTLLADYLKRRQCRVPDLSF
ncbi:MAG: RNA-directed DNA polymerase [Actinomycetota bacterium]